jgi:ribosomal protein S18 acetylase RimI-like enzyme
VSHSGGAGGDALVLRDGPVEPTEIEALRVAVGWDSREGTYETILERGYAHNIVREEGRFVGFLRILSDGVANAYLIDLMVHPDRQRRGIGSALCGGRLASSLRRAAWRRLVKRHRK